VRFRRGDLVRTSATVRPARYANRRGRVVVGRHEGEVGVQLGRWHENVWFLPSELTLESPQEPLRVPRSLATP
jgi:hypothetical protein